MTYLDDDADLIKASLPSGTSVPDDSDRLFRLYAVLLRTKRMRTTATDVHDAWTAWQQELDPEHEALKPYRQLPPDVQAEDEPFLAAIHEAASKIIDARATDHEKGIRRTFPELDTWSDRLSGVYRPAFGSDLAEDDKDWPPLAASQIAASSMVASCEHLQAFRAHVESRDLYVFAHETLLRTALLSAAQAVWVLGPDDREERISNARRLAAHIDTEHLKFLRDLARFGPDENAAAVTARITERLDELTKMRTDANQKEKFEATRVIRTAVGHVTDDEDLAAEVVLNWRNGSAAAHGLAWMAQGRASNRQTSEPDENGLVAIEVTSDIDILALPYLSAYRLLKTAHALLAQRGGV